MVEEIAFIETVATPIFLVIDEDETHVTRTRIGTSYYEYDFGNVSTRAIFDIVDERAKEIIASDNVYAFVQLHGINDWLKLCKYKGWPLHTKEAIQIEVCLSQSVQGNLIHVIKKQLCQIPA